MIILLNLISLNNNIAQSDDRAVRRPCGATTARHDRAGWTGKNLLLDEALGRAHYYGGFYHISSVSWVQRNVNKTGHGSDLSKWLRLAVGYPSF